jgi:hypothetical protein
VNTTLTLFLTANGEYVESQDHTRTVVFVIAGILFVITSLTTTSGYLKIVNAHYSKAAVRAPIFEVTIGFSVKNWV